MAYHDPHLKEVFPSPPLVAYKKPKTIRSIIIRAKVPKVISRPIRQIKGMKKCMNCPICPFVIEGKVVKSSKTTFVQGINSVVDCQTKNIIYCITCTKCSEQYIGQSERTLQARFSEHQDYVKQEKVEKA